MDWIAEKMNIEDISDWYKLDRQSILEVHDNIEIWSKISSNKSDNNINNISRALKFVYPETNWQLWRFPESGERVLDSREDISSFLDW
jgi:hypothetical protein